ncbi:RnfH family protein [Undibacterium sp. RTI2.1]|uniref:RnfH family protein n=1 Tax=unclassified Undibacterium TaxID=2630295 RepID=UPI002AB4C925|nr:MULTISPECIES: RnfH family protein [unclassified Undibacterium]MDY7537281.1 RnfH family protein [Undibacterium sp. 5I1]MEB0031826.1 RnfH family protein [Undibacterium sp. RTI2.1]MEB0117536.1 RnfH family protein [Undibacterium sp. RTI2.2]MEB0230306.1 RnfH family protein [Undibacterium sp. 10I3]MEB0258184.1 RnfH family protein [Undibacterium sp. 5I1]
MGDSNMIVVQVCYCDQKEITLLNICVSEESTLLDAFKKSRICELRQDVNLAKCKIGIFGKLKSENTILRAGDRVEIYRPLLADPMEARRRRAKKYST